MGLRINNNIPALNAQRQTRNNVEGLNRALGILASGLRINQAADDAAGLAISERFRAQIRQNTVEVNNLQSGVNALQTAEGGLGVQQEAVGRIRELAVQAANGTLSDADRQALNQEVQQLVEQIETTGQDTEFNGTAMLDGTTGEIQLDAEGQVTVNVNESTVDSLGLNGVDVSTYEGAMQAIEAADTAAQRIDQNRANVGAQQNRIERAIETRNIEIENATASESAIRDADYARVVQDQLRNQVLLQGGLGALTQANIVPQTAAQLLGG
jgi:flagellin